jgi:CheY-like chemotaxis protein
VRQEADVADVLVVEAEDLTRRLVEARLQDAGHLVRAVSSVAQAQELVALAGCPDVLVIDLPLPDGSGLHLAGCLRTEAGAADLPVIVLSSGRAAAADARAMGAAQLSKPFPPEALAAALTAVLAPVDDAVEQTVRSRLATFGHLDDYERDLIAELLATFVQRAPATEFAAERAIAAGDVEALQSAVRRLRTAALNLGGTDLAGICADLDAHAGRGPIPIPLAAHFRRVLGSTCRVFTGLAAEFRNEPLDAALVGAAHA